MCLDQESWDGQILFEVEMYLQKGCIIVLGVEASYRVFPSNKQKRNWKIYTSLVATGA